MPRMGRETNLQEQLAGSAGRKLRQVREELGLTLMECGKKAGISYTHISEIERGHVCPSLKTLEKLAQALNKPLSFFLQGDSPITLGEKLKKLRDAQGLTQAKLAAQLGISDSLIAQIETDKVKPSLATLEKLSGVFGVTVDYFLAEVPETGQGRTTVEEVPHRVTGGISRTRLAALEEAEEWQQDLVLNMLDLIRHYVPGHVEPPEDPVTREIISCLKEMSPAKRHSVLNYIKFVAREEDLHN